MTDYLKISDFLSPVSKSEISLDQGFKDGQIGKVIDVFDEDGLPNIENADIIFIGCGEQRGSGFQMNYGNGPDAIRKEFYSLYFWHQDIRLADLGNLRQGEDLKDTYAALKTVIGELLNVNKLVVLLGGSHDLSLATYYAFEEKKSFIEVSNIDALIDINMDSDYRSDNFLMEMLTKEPNFVRHYNHIGFQSYYVHPRMLETMDKLRFDCFRLGTIKENIEEMEPVLRGSHLLSFDISALAFSCAPINTNSPNGFNGEEACALMRYAGMSPNMGAIGIYGYNPEKDQHNLTAKEISQMIWYLLDGRSRGRKEVDLNEKTSFNEYQIAFAEVNTIFLQSKKTGRWWMQLPDKKFIACSYKDYFQASHNEIPERWLRAQERS